MNYRIDNSSVSLRPRGLINRSNKCYIHACIQALVACSPFYNLIKSIPRQPEQYLTKTPTVDAMVDLINEFSHVPPGARSIQYDQPFQPTVIYTLCNRSGQQDAEEFLNFIFNKLKEEMLQVRI